MGCSRDDDSSFERGSRRITLGDDGNPVPPPIKDFNAHKAAKLVEEYNQAQTREMEALLMKLLDAIYKDAKVGKTQLTYGANEHHHETLVKLLRQRGFEVEDTYNQKDGSFLTIRW